MKKISIAIAILFNVLSAEAQITSGLVAHWDMNSTSNDVSGNGHNGHQLNLTAAAGKDGIMGHGWYFNGTNSRITVPYSPTLNVTKYSICATIKVMGYYAGTCHSNMVINRGPTAGGSTGAYELYFSDGPAGYGCTAGIDTLQECFVTGAGATGAPISPTSFSLFNYTPHIADNIWYTVVATLNDTSFKIYVNGTLMSSPYVTTPGVPVGTSSDSLSIGYNIYDAPSYPYPFKGVIDDIMLYNRALTDSEVVHLNDTCGTITTQPVTHSTSAGATVSYTTHSSTAGVTYQWQQNAGTGFTNLSNAGAYSGVTTGTLTVTGVTAAMNNYVYRCVLSASWGCADTTSTALLTLGVDNVPFSDLVAIYPNPVKNIVTIQTPFRNADGHIDLLNEVGQVIAQQNISSKTTDLDLTRYAAGMYIVRIELDGHVVYKKIAKD